MGYSFFFDEDEDEVPESSDRTFAADIAGILAKSDRREYQRRQEEEPEWSRPLRQWVQERAREVPRRGRRGNPPPDDEPVPVEKPSPRMRRRRVPEPEMNVVVFPSPNRKIRAVCRDQAAMALSGHHHRVFPIGED
jgi:hypothetical protein